LIFGTFLKPQPCHFVEAPAVPRPYQSVEAPAVPVRRTTSVHELVRQCVQTRKDSALPPLPEPMDLGLDESIATDEWLQDSDAMFTGMHF